MVLHQLRIPWNKSLQTLSMDCCDEEEYEKNETHLKLRSENSCRSLSLSFSESRRSPWKVSSSTDCRFVLEISMCRMLVCEKSARGERRRRVVKHVDRMTQKLHCHVRRRKVCELPDLSFINCLTGQDGRSEDGLGQGSKTRRAAFDSF